jgi:hypothetical protein
MMIIVIIITIMTIIIIVMAAFRSAEAAGQLLQVYQRRLWKGDFQMPVAKMHVLEGRYDERRLSNGSKAVQEALISILKIPSDDFLGLP